MINLFNSIALGFVGVLTESPTATKLALNTLTTGAFARLGKVHGNRMVDLRPRSAKLRARALALVREIGLTTAQLTDCLEVSNAADVDVHIHLVGDARDVADHAHYAVVAAAAARTAGKRRRIGFSARRVPWRTEPEVGASVPCCACSNFPTWRAAAPVNAPFSWPKSSLSTRFSESAPQLTGTKEPLRCVSDDWGRGAVMEFIPSHLSS